MRSDQQRNFNNTGFSSSNGKSINLKTLMLMTLICVNLLLCASVFAKPSDFQLVEPSPDAEDINVWPIFSWEKSTDTGTVKYSLQIGTTPQFHEGTYVSYDELTDTIFRPSVDLVMNTLHYWRVIAYTDAGDSTYNDESNYPFNFWQFQTIPPSEPREILAPEPMLYDRTLISENTPYTIRQGDLDIPAGRTLTVRGGVTLKVEGDYYIGVHGQLQMLGTETDSIHLTTADSVPEPGDWEHIKFYDDALDAEFDQDWNYIDGTGSALKYVDIQHAGSDSAAIVAREIAVYISHCKLSNCANERGMELAEGSKIEGNYIHGFTGSRNGVGINCYDASNIMITGNTIRDCNLYKTNHQNVRYGGGVHIFSSSHIHFNNNVVDSCSVTTERSSYGGGIAVLESDSCDLYNNIIMNCNAYCGNDWYTEVIAGGGMYIAASDNITFDGNTITGNWVDGHSGIKYAYGGGMYVAETTIDIRNSVFTNNWSDDLGGGLYIETDCPMTTIKNSIIKYNYTIDPAGGGGIYGAPDTINYCNINHNDGFEIVKNSTDETIATNNWWFTRSDEIAIEEGIFDRDDTLPGELGAVVYSPYLTDVSDSTPGIFKDAHYLTHMEDSTYSAEATSIIGTEDTVYFEMGGQDENPFSRDVAVIKVFNRRSWESIRPFYEETGDSTGIWQGCFIVSAGTVLPNMIGVLDGDTLDVKVDRDQDVNIMIVIGGDMFMVETPDGGECLKGGEISAIDLKNIPDTADALDLYYTVDNGLSWDPICSGITADSIPYDWSVPMINSVECRVRAVARQGAVTLSEDESNADFSIDSNQPTVTITSPAGGEDYPNDTTITIEWTADDNGCGLDCEVVKYSLDNGGNWHSIDSCSASGVSWITPDSGYYGNCLVKVVAYDRAGWSGEAVSGAFAIGDEPPEVQLDFIAIEGPDSVMENSSARYSCRAYYTDGSDSLISDSCLVNWGTSCAEAEFDQNDCNLLLTSVVAEDIACQLSASYTEDSIEKSVDKSILVVNDTMTATADTVFVGNGYYDFSHEHISDEALCVPIFINNHTQLGGGSLPIVYDCSLEPDTVMISGTRLDGADLLTTTIDTVENTISIGFITDLMGSGFFLEPVTQETVDDPVALIFFYKSCEQQASCDSVFYSMDTATIGMVSLTLSDVAGQVVDCNFESNAETVDVYIPGEANSDCSVDVSDAMFVYNWIFIAGAPAPYCIYASDANGDCDYNVADPVYLINFIFRDGPPPLSYCSAGSPLAKPFLPSVELIVRSTFDGDDTHIEFISSAPFDIHGVQLEIACDNPVHGLEVVNLTGDMNLIADSRSNRIDLGMIDFSGNSCIPAGQTTFTEIELDGKVEIAGLDAVVADIDGQAYAVDWIPVVKQLPQRFTLDQNRPNPFNPATEISYSLPEASDVRLDIFNIMGQKVSTVVDKHQEAGIHSVVWNGRDDNGRQVASGIYFYRMNADDFTETKKMILMK